MVHDLNGGKSSTYIIMCNNFLVFINTLTRILTNFSRLIRTMTHFVTAIDGLLSYVRFIK